MTFKLLTLICLLVQLCLSCDYINVNGYGYPSGGCYSLDYMPSSFSYNCDTTSSFNLQEYNTAGCANSIPVIDSDTATSFNCNEYNTPNTCDVVEYENWLYAANCTGDIYVERKTFVIDNCFPASATSSVMITCDMETITFTHYSDLHCSSISRTDEPYGESYRITKCGDQELDYCNEPGAGSLAGICDNLDNNCASFNAGNCTKGCSCEEPTKCDEIRNCSFPSVDPECNSCKNMEFIVECAGCKDGYVLNDANECKEIITQTATCDNLDPKCVSFNACSQGCNCEEPTQCNEVRNCFAVVDPKCASCGDGYTLNTGTGECDRDTNTCPDIDNCAEYTNGCECANCADGYSLDDNGECVVVVNDGCTVFGFEPEAAEVLAEFFDVCSICFREKKDATTAFVKKCKKFKRIIDTQICDFGEYVETQALCMLDYCATQNTELIGCDLTQVRFRDESTITYKDNYLVFRDGGCNCDTFTCDLSYNLGGVGGLETMIGLVVVLVILTWM